MSKARRELLDDLGERVLARRALLDRQAPPLGLRLEERVGDVLALEDWLLAHESHFTWPFSAARAEAATRPRLSFGRSFG